MQREITEPAWSTRNRDARIYRGDARNALRLIASESIQCCVTSPPYWGLRDYGTAEWEGGDAACDHRQQEVRQRRNLAEAANACDGGSRTAEGRADKDALWIPFRDTCGKCGARRIDRQLGLEKTPEEYVAKMVDVFREVRRVLRDDGTLWLNLGITYAGSGMTGGNNGFNASGGTDGFKQKRQFKRAADDKLATRSPLLRRDLACDIGGKEPLCSPVGDRACLGFCDEPPGETPIRRADTDDTCQPDEQCERPPLLKVRDIERSDCEPEPRGALPRDAQETTKRQSSCQHPGACDQLDAASAFQLSPLTLPPGAVQSEHTTACIYGTFQTRPPLETRTQGKESFFSACHRSDCRGIGRCGLCWCSLTIPSLGIKAKDEVNIPHLVAMALQADGWTLRQTIVWHKPNPMPESVTDRCTKSHEYIFLLAKSARYYYDAEAVKESAATAGAAGLGFYSHRAEAMGRAASGNEAKDPSEGVRPDYRNRRSVWTVSTKPYSGAHFATFPPDLIEPCILAGCPEGGVVLDPFNGSGTTGAVCIKHGRQYVGIELNPEYIELSKQRIGESERKFSTPLFSEIPKGTP